MSGGGAEGGLVEAEGLHGFFEAAEWVWQIGHAIEESVGLSDEEVVPLQRRGDVPGPVGLAVFEESPAALVDFDFQAAVLAVNLEGVFVGCLELIDGIGGEDIAVARGDVHGIFYGDAIEREVSGIAEEAGARADEPLDGIDHVGERVLDGTAAEVMAGVVDLAVSRAEGREMLAGRAGDVEWLAERTLQ